MHLDQYTNILYLVLGLVVLWIILRFVLRIAWKVFSLGCSLLLAFGLLLFLIRYLSGTLGR